MYTPAAFAVPELADCLGLIQTHPLATLVVHTQNGLEACPLPLYWAAGDRPEGRLLGHMARANPLWQQANPAQLALVIFQGDQHYISPSWYASKAEAGKVVPTWNYQAVHAHARLICHDDAEWVRHQMTRLTEQQEASQPHPWQVSDAPADYTQSLLKAVVGVELIIERLEGKFKLSQNQPDANRQSVIAALEQQDSPAARQMAQQIRNTGQR